MAPGDNRLFRVKTGFFRGNSRVRPGRSGGSEPLEGGPGRPTLLRGACAAKPPHCGSILMVMRVLKVLLALGLLLGVLGAGAAAFTIWHFSRGLPDYQQLASYQPAIV